MKLDNLLVFAIITLSIILSFLLGNIYQVSIISKPDTKLFDNNTNCSGLNLVMTSDCLNKQVNSFFNYNMSNRGKALGITQLKKEGGVCQNYAEYYAEMDESLGFYSENVIIDIDNKTTHAFNIISNYDGYCIQDQTVNFCIKLDLNKTKELENES